MATRDNFDPDKSVLADAVEEAFDPTPNDPDEPRDPAWLRWSKFSAIIFVLAVAFGLAFAFEDYFEQFDSKNDYKRSRAEKRVEHDTIAQMKFRVCLGAGVGAALGGVYVVRCLIRKVDP